MQEGQDANLGPINSMPSKLWKGYEPGSTGIHNRGDPVIQTDMGINAIEASFVPVTMQVNQAGANKLLLQIDDAHTCIGTERGAQILDSSASDAHIHLLTNPLGGINHVSPFEKQVIFHSCR
jgi:hypothetical protein